MNFTITISDPRYGFPPEVDFSDDELEAWNITTDNPRGEPQLVIRHLEGGMPLHLSKFEAGVLAILLDKFFKTGELDVEAIRGLTVS